MATPHKFTPEATQLILAAIRAGAFDYMAAEAAGVTRESFRQWVARGERAASEIELLETLAYPDLRTEAKSRNVSIQGSRDEILARLLEKELAYQRFAGEVRRARALARVEAERNVYRSMPFNWLRFGPGRERPGEPGWTDSSSPDELARISSEQAKTLAQVCLRAISNPEVGLDEEKQLKLRELIADGLREALSMSDEAAARG